jgi:mRNA-degrading endonuclease YafQ of YafQ-DinJ toxin-antitoxin module
MTYRLIYPESYLRRARKFLTRHPEILGQYRKTLELLELDPTHPSLRLHRLQGPLSDLASVSINLKYRIIIEFVVQGQDILLVNIGKHDQVYGHLR